MTMRFITITTANYARNTIRLVRSLRRVHPEAEITVFTDDGTLARRFAAHGATLHVLPQIAEMSVKRAKFFAYAIASKAGDFVYLDGDIVVLKPLDALWAVGDFVSTRDDLSGCDFIPNRDRPWERHPELSGSQYFNSGVFYARASLASFFERVCVDVRDDRDWNDLIIPGKLHDNHYLCAKIVQYGIETKFVSEYAYNWQGFLQGSNLRCHVDGAGELCADETGEPLHLVHFAGVSSIESFIATLPTEVLGVLARAVGAEDAGLIEAVATLVPEQATDARPLVPLLKAMGGATRTSPLRPGADTSLLQDDALSVASIALSTIGDDTRWNGLRCGNAYLGAAEYRQLRDFVRAAKIDGILEFGAGYTTVLFHRLVERQMALEGWDGPWLQFAREQGAAAQLVPFSHSSGFAEDSLKTAIDSILKGAGKSMVFLDSPQGTDSRACVAEQIIAHAGFADFVVVHDSVRDARNVYRLAAALKMQVLGHFPSLRGLTFLGREAVDTSSAPPALDEQSAQGVRFAVKCERFVRQEGHAWHAFIELRNVGDTIIPCTGESGWHFALHFKPHDTDVVWDTPRYTLPVDLAPRDALAFWVAYDGENGPLELALCDFVKEGEYWWSLASGEPCPAFSIKTFDC
jgi:hypothetical protein